MQDFFNFQEHSAASLVLVPYGAKGPKIVIKLEWYFQH